MLIQINSFLIFNTVLVLGINVPGDTRNDSDICMDKTLLNSCTKTCGESQCDMDSFCGEDKRCIYCYDAICKSMPIKSGCEISCAKRFTGMFEVGLQYVNFLSFSCSHQVLLIIGSTRWLNMHLIHQFCVFCKKFSSWQSNWTCIHVVIMNQFFFKCVKNLKYLFQTRFIIAMPKKNTHKKGCLTMVGFFFNGEKSSEGKKT